MQDSFLPTMPEEVLSDEIRQELQRMEEIANKSYHTVTWYSTYLSNDSETFSRLYRNIEILNDNFFSGCPNGHPYAVGDVSIYIITWSKDDISFSMNTLLG